MNQTIAEMSEIIDDLTKQRNHYENELIEKRREVIDLTAELDRAKRKINSLEIDIKDEDVLLRRQALTNERWQEKVDYLEEQLAIHQINQWYLKPLFLFAAGFATSTVVITFLVRYL